MVRGCAGWMKCGCSEAGHVVGTRGSGIVSSASDECGAWDVRSRWSM